MKYMCNSDDTVVWKLYHQGSNGQIISLFKFLLLTFCLQNLYWALFST